MELSGRGTKILLWACFHRIDTETGPIAPSISDVDRTIRSRHSIDYGRLNSIPVRECDA